MYKLSPHISSLVNYAAVPPVDWHAHLGHANLRIINKLVNDFHLSSAVHFKNSECSSCLMGKFSKFSLPSIAYHSSHPLHLIHTDIWGPSPHVSSLGYKYFILLIDDFTRYTWYYPIK